MPELARQRAVLSGGSAPRTDGRGIPQLVAHQSRHELVSIAREPLALFFALVFPLLFFVIISALFGNATIDERAGVRVAQFMAPAFAAFGVVMATFSGLAIGLAEAREDGVLKRLRGTPLPPAVLIAGRVVAGGAVAFGAVLLLQVVGVLAYDVQIVWRTLPATLLTLLVGVFCFSALGLAVAALAPNGQVAIALTTGVVVPLSFISDIFAPAATQLPRWLDVIGWFFPLRHLANALGDATNPYLTGSGFYPDHLAVMAAWGLLGAVVAVRRLSLEPRHGKASAATGQVATQGREARDERSARVGRPSIGTLLVGEVRHADALLWRDPGSTFFAVAFPVLLVLLVPQIFGTDVILDDGTPLPRFYAPTMAVYGAAVTAYVNMPEGLARARERGVLHRLSGTPLPMPMLLLGRVLSSVWIALLTLVAVLGLAGVLYDVPVPQTWPGVVVTIVLSTMCFAVLGVMLVTLLGSSRAVNAVALGTLLPLSFVSDIFLIGATFPTVLTVIGWASPLRHATRAVSDAYAVGATGYGFAWGHLAVIAAWLVAGALVVALRTRSGRLATRQS